MIKVLNNYKNIIIILMSFILLSIMSIILMLHEHVLFSDYNNIEFHAKRIMEFKNLLLHGHLNVPFSFNYFHGSSIMGMYPFFDLLPFVCVSFLVSSYVKIYNYSIAIIIFVSLLISYFSSLKYSKSKVISYIFAILYNISPVLFYNAYSNGDLGITMSLVVLPLSIFGYIDIINGSNNSYKLILGILFLSLCQIPTTIIVFAFLLFWTLINIERLSKLILHELVMSMLIIVMITGIIWIPVLKIILFNSINTPGTSSNLIQSSNIISLVQNIGIIPILFALLSLIFLKRFNKIDRQAYLLSLLILLLSSKLIPIKFITRFGILKIINKFQFTSRFLIIPQIIFCYLSAWMIFIIAHNLKFRKLSKMFIIFILCLSISSQLLTQINIIHNEYDQSPQIMNGVYPINKTYLINKNSTKYLYNGYTNNTDYYPKISGSKAHYINYDKGYYGDKHALNVKQKGYNSFIFNSKRDLRKLYLPLLKYDKEDLVLKLNGKNVHYSISRYNTLILNHIHCGRYIMTVKYIPNVYLVYSKYILLFIGFILLVLTNIKHNIIK